MTANEELQRRHSAFLVADIVEAKEAFTATAGTPFGEVMRFPIRVENESTSVELEVTFAHALDGSVELIEASTGPFAPDLGLGFHHVGGIGSVDLDEAVERQARFGSLVDWRLFMGDRQFAVFFKPTALRPARLEVMAPFMAEM